MLKLLTRNAKRVTIKVSWNNIKVSTGKLLRVTNEMITPLVCIPMHVAAIAVR
jgi:hypothetical protein